MAGGWPQTAPTHPSSERERSHPSVYSSSWPISSRRSVGPITALLSPSHLVCTRWSGFIVSISISPHSVSKNRPTLHTLLTFSRPAFPHSCECSISTPVNLSDRAPTQNPLRPTYPNSSFFSPPIAGLSLSKSTFFLPIIARTSQSLLSLRSYFNLHCPPTLVVPLCQKYCLRHFTLSFLFISYLLRWALVRFHNHRHLTQRRAILIQSSQLPNPPHYNSQEDARHPSRHRAPHNPPSKSQGHRDSQRRPQSTLPSTAKGVRHSTTLQKQACLKQSRLI